MQASGTCADAGMACGLEIMFHRTKEDNIQGISERGLLVADGVDLPIANGSKLGKAVYLSTTFYHGKKYGQVCILCLALPGHRLGWKYPGWPCREANEVAYFSKCWENVIFAYGSADQVLPLTLVHDGDLEEQLRKAKALKERIENIYPALQPHSHETLHASTTVDDAWVKIESRRVPGVFYYFNFKTGESKASI